MAKGLWSTVAVLQQLIVLRRPVLRPLPASSSDVPLFLSTTRVAAYIEIGAQGELGRST
jgi:hypothetical protein